MREAVSLERVEIVPRCSQDELDQHFASARFLVQASLEEGFGLPVWEALAAGITVCSSTGGALAEIGADAAARFDPTSLEEMATALDQAAAEAWRRTLDDEVAASRAFLQKTPTPEDYARGVEDAVLEFISE